MKFLDIIHQDDVFVIILFKKHFEYIYIYTFIIDIITNNT